MEPSTAVKAPIMTNVFITSCSRLISCDREQPETSDSWRTGPSAALQQARRKRRPGRRPPALAEARNHGRFSRFVASIHDRQMIVLDRSDWLARMDLTRPEVELLRPLLAGSLPQRPARSRRDFQRTWRSDAIQGEKRRIREIRPRPGDATEDNEAFLIGNRADRIDGFSRGRLLPAVSYARKLVTA